VPYLLIFLAVLAYSIYPSALIQFVTGKVDLLVYLWSFQFLAAISQIVMMFSYSSVKLQSSGGAIADTGKAILTPNIFRIGLLNATFNTLAFGCFFFALTYGDPIRATVFYELWASVFLILTMIYRRNAAGKYEHRQGVWTTAVFLLVGIVGVVLVVSAERDTLSADGTWNVLNSFALAAAVAAPILMAISFLYGTQNARSIANSLRTRNDNLRDERLNGQFDFLGGIYHGVLLRSFSTVLLTALLPFLYFMGIWTPQYFEFSAVVVGGIIICALIASIGSTLANIANNLSVSSNLNLFWNFTPFLAVIFLNLFGYSDATPPEIFFGAILILSANYILSTEHSYSVSFRSTILALCGICYVLLFVPPLRITEGYDHIDIPLGLFGLFAAFFIDRIARGFENPDILEQPQSNTIYTHNIFVLWILGFGSIVALLLFRPEHSIIFEFVLAVIAVAVFYMCLLPIEHFFGSQHSLMGQAKRSNWKRKEFMTSITVSAIFISLLFTLFLFALLQIPEPV